MSLRIFVVVVVVFQVRGKRANACWLITECSICEFMEFTLRRWRRKNGGIDVRWERYSFIVIASTTDYSRKILNSSTYAEPCLVRSAKQILCREFYVISL